MVQDIVPDGLCPEPQVISKINLKFDCKSVQLKIEYKLFGPDYFFMFYLKVSFLY